MKKFKGFTLVELIVVIAIIGVLAAILVPNMMGYISKSKLSSANTAAKNVQTAVVTYCADQMSMGQTPSVKITTASGKVADFSSDKIEGTIKEALSGNSNTGYVAIGMVDSTGTKVETDYSEKVILWAQWKDSSDGTVWGQYPNAQSDYTTFKNDTTGTSPAEKWGVYVDKWSNQTGS